MILNQAIAKEKIKEYFYDSTPFNQVIPSIFKPEPTQELIEYLGYDTFQIRETAQSYIIYLDNKMLPLLKENYNHQDPEIKFRVRYILSNFIHDVLPPLYAIPYIWYLPPELRWQTNVWNEQTKSYANDIAKNFYDEQYIIEREPNGPKHWPGAMFGANLDRTIKYDFQNDTWYNHLNQETAKYATINYIKYRRMVDCLSKQELKNIINQMKENMEKYRVIGNDEFNVPSCMLIKNE